MTNINRELEILKYRVNRNKEILHNWKTFEISQKKIEKLENKIARDEQIINNLENS